MLADQAGPTTEVDQYQCRRSRSRGQDRLIGFFGMTLTWQLEAVIRSIIQN